MPIVEHLIAEQFGTHIGKYQERLKVTKKGDVLIQAPLLHLQSVHILSEGVSLSADVIKACAERGIPIFFVDTMGEAYSSLYASGLVGTVITRREQLRAYDDPRGIHIAIAIASAKIQNQSATLRYLAKNRADDPIGKSLIGYATNVADYSAKLGLLPITGTIDDIRQPILSIEANAASTYWEAVRMIIPDSYGWERREGRGATDPMNVLLNYGYGMLYGQIERAIVLAGLDPFAGFIHTDRPGKPSLTLDMIEEFRSVIVDRAVIGLLTRNFVVDFTEQGRLADDTKRTFATHILDRYETKMRYPTDRFALKHIIQMQARALASYVRGDSDEYKGFKVGQG
ncbi:MAG: CRISPR-associated endonuclease Cas1 [bacterium]|nr:CRISPR-associated endonuclease Cas1 [bacterium]